MTNVTIISVLRRTLLMELVSQSVSQSVSELDLFIRYRNLKRL
jgi:hypothetical protein